MELALQVVGLKMTGKIEDARDVAMRIVNTTGPDNMGGMSPHSQMQMQLATSPALAADIRHILAGAGEAGGFEKLILDFLAVLDTPMHVPTRSLTDVISHTTEGGQTLLHLAAFLGFTTLVDFLLEHHIDVDARDKNGYTALHFAALKQTTSCARLLVGAGADVDIVNALGKTAAETAPARFFEDLFKDVPDVDNLSVDGWGSEQREEEAAWGDIEEDGTSEDETSSPSSPRTIVPRRLDRRSSCKDKPSRRPIVESSADEKPPVKPSPTTDIKKPGGPDAVDDKQVASIMEMVQRTIAQLQHPQGMIPNLPLHLPGMPAWGALPQMPAVFPVYVPIPALMAFFGDKRDQDGQAEGEDSEKAGSRNQQWLGIPTTQDWKAFIERWVVTARTNEEAPPPAYTPRETDTQTHEEKEKHASGSSTAKSEHVHGPGGVVVRRVGYEPVPVPEQEVKSYGYRPAKKQSRKGQKKHDRMLILFWIPILFSEYLFSRLLVPSCMIGVPMLISLIVGVIWAFLHSVRMGFNAVTALLALKAGLA